MQKLSHLDCSDWQLNPHEVLGLVYSKITNAPEENPRLIAQIEHFQYPFLEEKKTLDTRQGITYLLAIVLNSFYGSDEGTIKIINNLIKSYPAEFSKRSGFTIFMTNLLALAVSKVRPGRKADQLENILVHIHANSRRFKISQFSASILKMTRAQQLRNRGEYIMACEYCDDCIHLFKRNQMNLNCILAYNLAISIYADMNDIAKVNEYKYERLCFMDEHNISTRIFALPKDFTEFKTR